MSKVKQIGEATAEQIAEWKKKYGPGKVFTVDGHICYMRRPTRVEVAAANAITNGIKSNEFLMNTCWLGGSDEIKKNDQLFYAVSSKMKDLITEKEAEIEDF